MPTNEERGELTISLDGLEYGMRPTFEALKAVEKATGMSLRGLAMAANQIDLSIVDMGAIVAEFMRAWGKANPEAEHADVATKVRDGRVADLILAEGIVSVSALLTVIFAAAIRGGVTATGELRAPVATGTTTDA